MVNRGFNHRLEALLQMLLGDIMLVLADPNGFGIDLDELGQRVLHPAGDRDCASLSDVKRGELLLRELRCGVYACSSLADDQVSELLLLTFGDDLSDELLGFARSRSVADDNELDGVFINQLIEFGGSFALLVMRRCRIGHRHLEQLACVVDDGKLTACPVGGVNAKDVLALHRRLQKQAAKVA
ncbi:hypothetical protein D3C73_549910 [compost metagenome]